MSSLRHSAAEGEEPCQPEAKQCASRRLRNLDCEETGAPVDAGEDGVVSSRRELIDSVVSEVRHVKIVHVVKGYAASYPAYGYRTTADESTEIGSRRGELFNDTIAVVHDIEVVLTVKS